MKRYPPAISLSTGEVLDMLSEAMARQTVSDILHWGHVYKLRTKEDPTVSCIWEHRNRKPMYDSRYVNQQ